MDDKFKQIRNSLMRHSVSSELFDDIYSNIALTLENYDFKDKEDLVEKRIGEALLKEYSTLNISHKYPINSIEVIMPWHRMFEIGAKFK